MSKQVVMVLTLLRQNITQSVAADPYGIIQPSVSRISRRILPILEQVTCLHTSGDLADLAQDRVVLVDGTDVPTNASRLRSRRTTPAKDTATASACRSPRPSRAPMLAVSDPAQVDATTGGRSPIPAGKKR